MCSSVIWSVARSRKDRHTRRSRARWDSIRTGDTASLGLTGIRTADVPEDAVQAVKPEPLQGGINGVVWRDFSPGGGTPGEVESEELGLPGVTVELRDADGGRVESATTSEDGTFAFESLTLWERRAPGLALAYVVGSVASGLLAVVLGVALARTFVPPAADPSPRASEEQAARPPGAGGEPAGAHRPG